MGTCSSTFRRHFFPANKEEVASGAESNGAPQDFVDRIRNAATERFNGPEDVLQAVQGS